MAEDYPFMHADEFDSALIDGVENGYFADASLIKLATDSERILLQRKKKSEIQNAWQGYHGSFGGSIEDIVKDITEVTSRNIAFCSLGNLDETVCFLREFGFQSEADSLIDDYVTDRADDPGAWDLGDFSVFTKIEDERIRTLRLNAEKRSKANISPLESLIQTGKSQGYNSDSIDAMLSLDSEQWAEALRSLSGATFRSAMYGFAFFNNVHFGDDSGGEVQRRLRHAMQSIAADSELNAKRVKLWLKNQ